MVTYLHMGWRDICFANWPVDPDVVADHLPEGLAVDTYDDRAWLSVTPFTNVDVRPWFLPRGWGVLLPEINLRTYVVPEGVRASERQRASTGSEGEQREPSGVPGIYFFSLDADGLPAVLGARATHRLPYFQADVAFDRGPGIFRFESDRTHPGAPPARFCARYEPVGDRFRAAPGSLAHFLTHRERYYTEGRRGELRYADVSHEPWPVYRAEATVTENTLFEAAGLEHPASEPTFLYSPGVDTLATPSRRA